MLTQGYRECVYYDVDIKAIRMAIAYCIEHNLIPLIIEIDS